MVPIGVEAWRPTGTGHVAVISIQPANNGDFTLNGFMALGTLQFCNHFHRHLTGTGTLTFSVSGMFSELHLPTLPIHLAWDDTDLNTLGTISIAVIPEPMTLLLLGAVVGGAAGGTWWRRQTLLHTAMAAADESGEPCHGQ